MKIVYHMKHINLYHNDYLLQNINMIMININNKILICILHKNVDFRFFRLVIEFIL